MANKNERELKVCALSGHNYSKHSNEKCGEEICPV